METVTSGETYKKIGDDVCWKEEIHDFKGATMTSPCCTTYVERSHNNVYATRLKRYEYGFL